MFIAIVCIVIAFGGVWAFRASAGKPLNSPVVSQALSKRSQTGLKGAEAALKVKNAKVKSSMKFDIDCVGKSEQQLREYFLSNPCKGLARAYIRIGDIRRNLVLVAISWVEMPSVASAEEYGALVFDDVGNVIELSREVKTLNHITYEDRVYTSGVEGVFVWQVEVKPASSKVSEIEMNDILERSRQ
ncbi:hypothetical protein [Actinomadura sp. 7K534]|uniref:hypothetical protein n=1 Tax=Actinomadura sp. 7K534 TaxID=2530366 RepID=UPI00104B7F3F|nr:hypothetical protein [Actinomadura sp. 7K534]TDB95351.1 hypothetical protein E1266_13495 [Actinomadura sp. 7K534]